MWKNELRKAERLNSYDETNAFAMVLVELAVLKNVSDILNFYEKPYKYQNMYEELLQVVEDYYGEPASITEIVDVKELYELASKKIRGD
tara:strand:+ start:983 stop:1249 length:267 start_codon:yes stop_codon:yes gene_type:complete